MKRLFVAVAICSLIAVLVAACGGPGSGTDAASTVHMGDSNFAPTSATIKKGTSIALVNDVAAIHVIANGTWDNQTAKPAREASAPKIDLTVSGNDTQDIGPFNTAGTYHIYCTIHPDMNLTVIVQ